MNAHYNGNFACGLFVDLQKAFDTVDQEILFKGLNFYGIWGIANSFNLTYLTKSNTFLLIVSIPMCQLLYVVSHKALSWGHYFS